MNRHQMYPDARSRIEPDAVQRPLGRLRAALRLVPSGDRRTGDEQDRLARSRYPHPNDGRSTTTRFAIDDVEYVSTMQHRSKIDQLCVQQAAGARRGHRRAARATSARQHRRARHQSGRQHRARRADRAAPQARRARARGPSRSNRCRVHRRRRPAATPCGRTTESTKQIGRRLHAILDDGVRRRAARSRRSTMPRIVLDRNADVVRGAVPAHRARRALRDRGLELGAPARRGDSSRPSRRRDRRRRRVPARSRGARRRRPRARRSTRGSSNGDERPSAPTPAANDS